MVQLFILQQHEGVPSEQSIISLKKALEGGEGTDVGGGLLTALTAVRDGGLSEQEMTWPPLWETGPPQLQPPQLWASWVTTSAHRGRWCNSRAAATIRSAGPGIRNMNFFYLFFFKKEQTKSFKLKMWVPLLLHLFGIMWKLTALLCSTGFTCATNHCIAQQEVDQTGDLVVWFASKYEYSFKQTNYIGWRGIVDDWSNWNTLLEVYLVCEFVIYRSYIGFRPSLIHIWPYVYFISVLQQCKTWPKGQNWGRSHGHLASLLHFYEVVI